MLRYAGLNANPILVSTRSNGIPLFPTTDGFNYVIAGIEVQDAVILLDATERNSFPNILPNRALNWMGRLVRKDGSSSSVASQNKGLHPAKKFRQSHNWKHQWRRIKRGKKKELVLTNMGLAFRPAYLNIAVSIKLISATLPVPSLYKPFLPRRWNRILHNTHPKSFSALQTQI